MLYSFIRPSPFICLILKMLQIQPEKDIVVEFIKNEDFKYVRALGAYYMRLTGTALDCYKYLEPLYNDYRKIRRVNRDGTSFRLSPCNCFNSAYLAEALTAVRSSVYFRHVRSNPRRRICRRAAVGRAIVRRDSAPHSKAQRVGGEQPIGDSRLGTGGRSRRHRRVRIRGRRLLHGGQQSRRRRRRRRARRRQEERPREESESEQESGRPSSKRQEEEKQPREGAWR